MGTIHVANMEKAGLTKEEYENPEYLADYFINLWEDSGTDRKAGIAVCVSNKGCYHAHIACYGNTTTLKKVSDILCQAHVEPQFGGKEQLKDYLAKEGKYAEKGEHVLYSKGLEVISDRQGNRNDLDKIEALLNEGNTPEQIFEESFRYRRFEKMTRAHYLQKRKKETPYLKEMWNEYHFGHSGSGKTYTYIRLCEKYCEEDIYLCNDYANSGSSGGGFDYYLNNPAKILFMDEFRGNIPYGNLMTLLDKYSRYQQHARYQNVYNLWTSVYICSIYPPEEVYKFMVDEAQRNTDSITQFLRRFNNIVYHWKDKEGHYRAYTLSAEKYLGAIGIKELAEEFEKTVSYESYEKYKSEKEALEGTLGDKLTDGGEILD